MKPQRVRIRLRSGIGNSLELPSRPAGLHVVHSGFEYEVPQETGLSLVAGGNFEPVGWLAPMPAELPSSSLPTATAMPRKPDRTGIFTCINRFATIGQFSTAFINWLQARKTGGTFVFATQRIFEGSDSMVGAWTRQFLDAGLDWDEFDVKPPLPLVPEWLYEATETAIREGRAKPRLNWHILPDQKLYTFFYLDADGFDASLKPFCDIGKRRSLFPRAYPYHCPPGRGETWVDEFNLTWVARGAHIAGSYQGIVPLLKTIYGNKFGNVPQCMSPVLHSWHGLKISSGSMKNGDAFRWRLKSFLDCLGRRGLIEWLWQILMPNVEPPLGRGLEWMIDNFNWEKIEPYEIRIKPDLSVLWHRCGEEKWQRKIPVF